MRNLTKAGQRIGDWFLWIECETVKAKGYRDVPLVTVRRAISGGEILATVVASKEMAKELRAIADVIEETVTNANESPHGEICDEATP